MNAISSDSRRVLGRHVLKLDYDLKDARKRYRTARRCGFFLSLYRERLGLTIVLIDAWRTRHGMHVRVELDGVLSQTEIVALQAIAGSDAVRESLNLMRVRDPAYENTTAWNILFDERTKEAEGRPRDFSRRKHAPDLARAIRRATGMRT
jgi:hypothetical protein